MRTCGCTHVRVRGCMCAVCVCACVTLVREFWSHSREYPAVSLLSTQARLRALHSAAKLDRYLTVRCVAGTGGTHPTLGGSWLYEELLEGC